MQDHAICQMNTLTVVTDYGPRDLCFGSAGFDGGYEALATDAVTIQAVRIEMPVASLADFVAFRRAAGRPKDVVVLPAREARLSEK